MRDDLNRCDREIEELRTRPENVAGLNRAYIVVMGITDWEFERDLIAGRLNVHMLNC